MGVVENFLCIYCPKSVPHLLAKNYKCSFKFAKIIVKNLLASFFVDPVYFVGYAMPKVFYNVHVFAAWFRQSEN